MGTQYRSFAWGIVGTTFVGVLAACSGGAKSAGLPPLSGSAARSSSSSPAGNGAAASDPATTGAEPAGAEASTVRFVHPSGWRIDSPGPMTANADGGAAYQGPSDFLRVTSLAGSADPAGVASAEAANPTGPGFILVKGPHRASATGRVATEYEYREDAPANPVTGKAAVLHAVRLYVARPGGVYRVEYGSTGSPSSWDPQGASDIVTTFGTAA
jgi:hypothetical protein